MSPALKRYYWRSVLPCLAFVVLTAAQQPLQQAVDADSPWRTALALLPMPAWFWMLYEYARFLRQCDELERRIELGALVTGTGVGLSAALALLFLLDVYPLAMHAQQAVALTVMIPISVFALARHLLHRHYR